MDPHSIDEIYMQRCLHLAKKGEGNVAPNPLVGSVIVYNNQVIGEGYHSRFGEAHAEVNAINTVKDKTLLTHSTLYVNLEPCSHYGKTPPCVDLIIRHKIPKVVIGMQDPFAEVNGGGISRLLHSGCQVSKGILEEECKELNKAFITFHSKKRPYIVLKWAQTLDGYIDIQRKSDTAQEINWITNEECRVLVHKWRSEIQAIMVGKNTALFDNPKLDVRYWTGNAPLRIVTDRNLVLPKNLHLFNTNQPTWILNTLKNEKEHNLVYVKIDFGKDFINSLMEHLHQNGINQLLVEGGQHLLQSFITQNYWDEARIFIGNKKFGKGKTAPSINGQNRSQEWLGDSLLKILENK